MVLLLISDQDMFSDFCLRLHTPNVITNLSVTYCSVTVISWKCVCVCTLNCTLIFFYDF